jgi:quercetin dioxygenase-like cupin family protein
LHRHPQEELVVIKEGTLEINIDGKKQIAGPGSMIFYAANENENMTNVGKTPATYYVLQWYTALTPGGL